MLSLNRRLLAGEPREGLPKQMPRVARMRWPFYPWALDVIISFVQSFQTIFAPTHTHTYTHDWSCEKVSGLELDLAKAARALGRIAAASQRMGV